MRLRSQLPLYDLKISLIDGKLNTTQVESRRKHIASIEVTQFQNTDDSLMTLHNNVQNKRMECRKTGATSLHRLICSVIRIEHVKTPLNCERFNDSPEMGIDELNCELRFYKKAVCIENI